MQARKARQSLIAFTKATNPLYQPADHHHLIAEKLEAVERGEIKRLMIFMPPRHGKSELASRRFPAWYLGRNQRSQIICGSYNSDLATDFGREVRNIVSSEDCQNVFKGLMLSADSKAANRWHTKKGGIYYAVGVGGSATGRGADLLLIDDPVKDREEADSEVIREKVWNWYTSTAYTRLMPGAPIVIIQTRWHDDDLSGRLIQAQEMGGDQWEILSLKAIDEKREGRALWPGWFPIERLEQIKQVVGPRDWSALYQQNPVPDEGGYFQRDWIQWYNDKPKHLRIYGASDYAVTDDGGDYTVHLVVGVDPNDDIYLLDIWREQADSETWVEAFIELVKKWKPLEWAEENGQIIKGVGPFIVKRQRETEAYCYRRQFASSHDKPTRAQAIRGRMAQKRVFFPSGEDWAATMIHELMRFPAGKNDDQVDALSLVGRMLADMRPGQVPPKPEKIKFELDLTFNEMRDSVRRSRERDEW